MRYTTAGQSAYRAGFLMVAPNFVGRVRPFLGARWNVLDGTTVMRYGYVPGAVAHRLARCVPGDEIPILTSHWRSIDSIDVNVNVN